MAPQQDKANSGPYKTEAGDFSHLKEQQEQGFRGTVPDPTPNENYTAEGAAKGLPTPETIPAGEAGSTKRDPEKLYSGVTQPGEPLADAQGRTLGAADAKPAAKSKADAKADG